jgi:hypothetical protein
MTDAYTELWTATRPLTLVIACSDGRLQEATDAFLTTNLELRQYDRFYVPGGGGALAASGRDFIRAQQLRKECRYLIELHEVEHVILMFHGPAVDGPAEAMCADYRRKLAGASAQFVRARQEQDAAELLERRADWALDAEVSVYRCEVDRNLAMSFHSLQVP